MALSRFVSDFEQLGPMGFLQRYPGAFLLAVADEDEEDEKPTAPGGGGGAPGTDMWALFLPAAGATHGVTVGRSRKADATVPFPRISKQHIQLRASSDGLWHIADLHSKNGTVVDGKRLDPELPYLLEDDSELLLGPYVFRFLHARSFALVLAESLEDTDAIRQLEDSETATSPGASRTAVVGPPSGVLDTGSGRDPSSSHNTESAPGRVSPSEDGPGLTILRPLGRGGMADVVLAQKTGPSGFTKEVALKRLLPEFADDRDFLDMFLQEARIAARINHPNVVQIHELGKMDGRYFIEMEYVNGWDLANILKAARRVGVEVPLEVGLRLGADLCAGLHAAHTCTDADGRALEIVHRDISPHNVMVSAAGVAKITDFGISKAVDSVRRTQPGELKGKVSYMAPEQVDTDLGEMDERTDLFAAGVTVWEILGGYPPLRRDNDIETLRAVIDAAVPPLTEARADAPERVVNAIAKACAKDPADRFASASELQRELERALLELDAEGTAFQVAAWLQTITEDPAGRAVLPSLKGFDVDPSRQTPVTATARQPRPTALDGPTDEAKGSGEAVRDD